MQMCIRWLNVKVKLYIAIHQNEVSVKKNIFSLCICTVNLMVWWNEFVKGMNYSRFSSMQHDQLSGSDKAPVIIGAVQDPMKCFSIHRCAFNLDVGLIS